ncbi:fluoride efflux transporter FluC [Streptomyces sp. SudanB182_2057]|uniref:fluoride efflux transporter FluC n=1 Tax=Streptomyces sp. SudanB182_2057 TaxID=3035281 RepID=UPI003F57E6DD
MTGTRMTLLVAAGGAAGAAARAGADLTGPATGTGFPWTTWAVNLAGCALMGVLMTLLNHKPGRRPMWAGPVLGSGFLGGFTTFSAFSADVQRLLTDGHAPTAVVYAAATVAGALASTTAGAALTAGLLRRGTRGDR